MSRIVNGAARKNGTRRRQQLASAQTRRRQNLAETGKVLLQGFVPRGTRSKYKELKARLDARSMGDVLIRLLEDWEKNHGKESIAEN